jgi:lysozyme family protein
MNKVSPDPNTGCWLWKGYIDGDGYGHYSLPGGKSRSAHRVSWMLFKGEIPDGLLVCHKCDIRNCVNPDHLFLGTPAENQADMKRKGRSGVGEKNPCAKLKLSQVQEIKLLLKQGKPVADIAKKFALSKQGIKSIKYGYTWRHVQAVTAISYEGSFMADFELAFEFVMNHEDPHRSGKVNEDAGGKTRFGIAQKFHPALPEEFFSGPADEALKQAEEIMRGEYWDRMRLEEVRNQNVANKLFDMAVNMGVHQAAVYAQRAVNGMLHARVAPPRLAGAVLVEDGVLGDKSLAAINALEPLAYYQLLCEWSRQHYVHVASINAAQAVNLNGWLKRAAT